jgi:hypothetical protein
MWETLHILFGCVNIWIHLLDSIHSERHGKYAANGILKMWNQLLQRVILA